MKKSFDEQIASVQREISMRRRLYPKWIHDGRMSDSQAAHEIACMEEVLHTLGEARRKSESLG